MIKVDNLTKKYGKKTVVDNVSFSVESGEIVGFLGPNGAGKSTTMNIITGYISATDGTVSVCGHDILENPEKAKREIGYLPEQPPLYFDMTVKEYLNFVADLKDVPKAEKPEMLNLIMDLIMISHVSGRLIKNLSKGYRQRVGLASSLIGYPDVLILDEPTVGLDPRQTMQMQALIKKLGEKHTIILSSHNLQVVSAVCDRVLIINDGKIVLSGRPDEFDKPLEEIFLKATSKEDDLSAGSV